MLCTSIDEMIKIFESYKPLIYQQKLIPFFIKMFDLDLVCIDFVREEELVNTYRELYRKFRKRFKN